MDTTNGRVLEDLSALQAEIAKLKEANAQLKAKAERASFRKTTLKVTEKGGVSLYGLGRFPVTLYRSQWERLIKAVPEIQTFLDDNAAILASKDD